MTCLTQISRTVAVLIAACLALASLVTPSAAEVEGSSSDVGGELAGLTDSSKLTGQSIIEGSVQRPAGARSAAIEGALVYVSVWPSPETLADMKVGDALELTPIAVTRTDRRGSFALRPDPEVEIEHLRSRSGALDMEVFAVFDGVFVSHSFSMTPKAGEPVYTTTGVPDFDPNEGELDPETGDVVRAARVDLVLEADQPNLEASLLGDSNGGETVTPMAQAGSCPGGSGLKQNLGNRQVLVGAIHITASGKEMRFNYNSDAASTLGVGVSSSGSYGTFSSGGTVSRTRSLSTTYPWYKSATNQLLDTYYSYGKYCVNVATNGPTFHQYEVRPIKHEGGTNARSTTAPTANYCVPYNVAGSGGSKTSSNATTWSNGAKLGGAIGIDLSSRTGFTTKAKQEWVFKTPGRLCGTHDSPAGSPRRLVMKAS